MSTNSELPTAATMPIRMLKHEYIAYRMISELEQYILKGNTDKLTAKTQYQSTNDVGEPYIPKFTLPESDNSEYVEQALPRP